MQESTFESRALETPASMNKACDRCRDRKVRCDKKSPCSNCERVGMTCTVSPRVQRTKRSHPPRTPEYDGKLGRIDRRLEQMKRLVDTLITDHDKASGSPSPGLPGRSTRESCSSEPLPNGTPLPQLPQRRQLSAAVDSGREDHDTVVEGSSSLAAHSTFAVELWHNVASSDKEMGQSLDMQELSKALHEIVNALKKQQTPDYSFPPAAFSASRDWEKPPIESAVAAIRRAQDQQSMILAFFCQLLSSNSLSDLCLKVYFSEDYSEAEFIILNVALYFLFSDPHQKTPHPHLETNYQTWCAANLQKALGGLSLHVRSTHDTVLSLTLGALYAVHTSQPSLAWTLVAAAHQAAYLLGFHTQQKGSNKASDVPNRSGLLFWVIYYIEKTLSLRIGRLSTIPDFDITVPQPGGNRPSLPPATRYCRLQIKYARVASKTYEHLYCARALCLPNDVRRQRVLELSQELRDINEQFLAVFDQWLQLEENEYRKEVLNLMKISDRVVQLSLLTLIHRAVPPSTDPNATFTSECLAFAREALEHHHSYIPTISSRAFSLSSYINWTILFSPFIPFIVIFCHAIQTGNEEDLRLMESFVKSIESVGHCSTTITNHYRLFLVFHDVALRYTALKSSLSPSQQDQMGMKAQMDQYLSSIGAFPLTWNITGQSIGGETQGSSETASMQLDEASVNGGINQASQLATWFNPGQQMAGWLDTEKFPF
ncbi:hypothetical protein GGS23DRAFT_565608 [Durotheca rogersii]|uniref:uncharacterized protein n=1 Tax=Durotheca rogersii TaxID=419775 RepID=UPI00221F2D82|nr:uncharacterized protein GGS23DRAFT_565608 [Durotheca rogersii]KAI5863831.1 hypothetical protein GGS23DRAFT_565608 [Durotheca rogersii]